MQKSSIILSCITELDSVIGDKIKADKWHGLQDHIYTFQINLSNFSGSYFIEATLVQDPSDADWFTIVTNNYSVPTTNTHSISINGIYTWIRARMNRDYALITTGFVDKIFLNQ